MDELGSILREAREARGYSLDDVQQSTRINPRYLQALEEGRYELLPTPVHVRGYLRNYAHFLSIDPQPLLDRYESTSGYQTPIATASPDQISLKTPIPARQDNPFFNPVNMQLNPVRSQPNTDGILRIVVAIALLASIALVASRFFLEDGREFDIRDAFNTLINREAEPGVDDLDIEGIVEGAQVTAESPLVDTGRGVVDEENMPTALPTIALDTQIDADTIALRLEITERTWLQVRVDGVVAFEGQAVSGEVLEFTAQSVLQLKTGNAQGIVATINGEELGRLGAQAQVVDHTWETAP